MKKFVLGSTLVMALLFAGLAQAQMGAQQGQMKGQGQNENVSSKRHPNLSAAQHHIDQALEKITTGQQANEWDLGGHAKKAKELLDEANKEIKEAAEFANKK